MNLTRDRLNAEEIPKRKNKKSAILREGVTYGMTLENPNLEDINSVIVVTFQVRVKFMFFYTDHDIMPFLRR